MEILVGGRGSRLLLVTRGVFLGQQHADKAALATLVFEKHDAVNAREQRIVLGTQDILPGLVMCAPLAHQDAAAGDCLPTEPLDSEPLALRVASVSR